MPELITCAECGKQLSSSLNCCPHCGQNPHLTKCDFCGKQIKHSEIPFHKSCEQSWQEVVFSESFCCRVCHKEFTYGYANQHKETRVSCDDFEQTYFRCPECGEHTQMTHCSYCKTILYPYGYKKITVQSRNALTDIPFHDSCFSKRKQYVKQSSCFIATAACSENSLEVITLRAFRDEYLLLTLIGRRFITIYEQVSPPLAKYITQYPIFRSIIKYCVIKPICAVAKTFMMIRKNNLTNTISK
ncbi:restriction system mrr homolog [Candidatus Vecturithrix granuli]|uniref:Restriction system mrr homolog n=1 Tax=Vecturithrix granuli TaxID=1499967 RepID=A0A081C3X9_VECG1|nr:restriction system mrr homolog [Candidatus Vecturithrix granuli]